MRAEAVERRDRQHAPVRQLGQNADLLLLGQADGAASRNRTEAVMMPSVPSDAPAAARPRGSRDGWIYLFITLATLGVWGLSRQNLFKAGDDVGYWIAVAGGLMMLALLSYPLRKYVRAFSRLGSIKGWFLVHMMLGICGPLLILLHSNFEIGSLNAGVAFFSMVIVALSGVVGRFLATDLGHTSSFREISIQDLQVPRFFQG